MRKDVENIEELVGAAPKDIDEEDVMKPGEDVIEEDMLTNGKNTGANLGGGGGRLHEKNFSK